MRRSFPYFFLLTAALTAGFLACQTNEPKSDQPRRFSLVFTNMAGSQPLKLGNTYKNALGESFTPTNFNYFVSNVRLTRTDGTDYVVPQDSSYFLIRQADSTRGMLNLSAVPLGEYKAVSFVVGVDSLRSTMDISKRTGVLDPAGDHTGANGMYWSWNSGYIFMKLEGTSPAAPVDATGKNNFRYHIGFFGGRDTKTINNLKTITIPFDKPVSYVRNTAHWVTIKADVLKIFDGPTPLSIKAYPEVMVSPYSVDVATNYAQMFSFGGTGSAIVN